MILNSSYFIERAKGKLKKHSVFNGIVSGFGVLVYTTHARNHEYLRPKERPERTKSLTLSSPTENQNPEDEEKKKQFRLGVSALNHRASERLIPVQNLDVFFLALHPSSFFFFFKVFDLGTNNIRLYKISFIVPSVLAAQAGYRILHSTNVNTVSAAKGRMNL